MIGERVIDSHVHVEAWSDAEGENKENILYRNFERRAGSSAKAVDTLALVRYIEKYKSLLSTEEWGHIEPYFLELRGETL